MKVSTGASMSLDGYVSGPGESGFEHLFNWYENGDVEMPTGNPDMTFRLTRPSFEHQTAFLDELGALVVGRKLFDMTNGWGGMHPLQVPTVVLTAQPAGRLVGTTSGSPSSPTASRARSRRRPSWAAARPSGSTPA